jgi:hypothetical protein
LPTVASLSILAIAAGALFLLGPNDILLGGLTYLLSSMGTSLCLAWDSVSQRRGLKSPNFTPNRGQSKLLQFLAVSGIAIAVIHIIRISETIAEYLSELWGLV